MKLISRFKDYYDSLRALDRDPDPVYLRETETHSMASLSVERRFEADRLFAVTTVMPRIYGVERGVLGFCGRLFPFYIVGPTVCYAHAPLVDALETMRVDADDWLPPRRALEAQLANLEPEWGYRERRIDDAPFLAFRSPVLWRREAELVTNPRLKALQFAAQVDAYSAWQELSMFLGNNLVSAAGKAPRPISDALKAEAKGFDAKTSFRNQKNRKKSERGDW